MRWMVAARAGGWAMCVVLFGVLAACGLNLVERAQNDLIGVDRPVSSVRIERVAEHGYLVYLLGTSYCVDLGDEVAVARRAGLRTSLVAREGVRRAAAAARCAAQVMSEACTRLRTWLQNLWATFGSGGGCRNPRAAERKDGSSRASKPTMDVQREAITRP